MYSSNFVSTRHRPSYHMGVESLTNWDATPESMAGLWHRLANTTASKVAWVSHVSP